MAANGKKETLFLPGQEPHLWTVKQIAASINQTEEYTRRRLRYLGIPHVSTMGTFRLYDDEAVDNIQKSKTLPPKDALRRPDIALKLDLTTARVIVLLKEAGIKPIAVGAHCTHYYSHDVISQLNAYRSRTSGRPRKWWVARIVIMVIRFRHDGVYHPHEALAIYRELGIDPESEVIKEISLNDAQAIFAKINLTWNESERKLQEL